MNHAKGEKHRVTSQEWIALAGLVGIVIGLAVVLGWESTHSGPEAPHRNFLAISHWFDPVFFQYNLVLLVVAVLVVPLVTLSYVWTMMGRKEQRLSRELPADRRAEMPELLASRMGFTAYLGSVSLTTIVVLLGASIILLFKPAPSAGPSGVDFSLGANTLMMGPFIELFDSDPRAYYVHLTRSLTAFQFGFLGAYIYFIGTLSRAYFTLDLTPQTFVDGTIRMITASVLALVISFAPWIHGSVDIPGAPASTVAVPRDGRLADGPSPPTTNPPKTSDRSAPSDAELAASGKQAEAQAEWSVSLLPIVSFIFGFFPKWALRGLRNMTSAAFHHVDMTPGRHRELPLSMLGGVSYMHEARLEREGFDNIENFSTADPVGLAACTGFTYPQLVQWVGSAWLATHLREDYHSFVQHTGITTRDELERFLAGWEGSLADAVDQLAKDAPNGQAMKTKLTVLGTLLGPAKTSGNPMPC
jgi:hypothetical protein